MIVFNNKKDIHLIISSYLLILTPLFLILGPFLTNVSVSVISIIFLITFLKKKKYELIKNKYAIIFLVFCIYLIFNSLLSPFFLTSFKTSFLYFRYLFFVLGIVYILEKKPETLLYFFNCLLLCFLFLIFDGFIQFFTGTNIFNIRLSESARVSSIFGDELILGSYVSRLFPILFGLSIFYKNKIGKNFFWIIIIFILAEVLIFLSGERSAFFYINLSAIYIIFMIKEFKALRIATLIISVIIIFIITSYSPVTKNRMITDTINQLQVNNLEKNRNVYFSKAHDPFFITAYNMFKQNKVFGVGIKNFRNFCNELKYAHNDKSCSTHPHNNYLQILAEGGIIGFGFLILLLITFFYKSFIAFILSFKKKYIFSDFEVCLLSAILISIWPLAPTGNLFNSWLSLIYYLPVGFLVWSIKRRKINN